MVLDSDDGRWVARRLSTPAERLLTCEVARAAVAAVAAHELVLFDRTSRAFFRRTARRNRPDIAGSGLDIVLASVSEAALAAGGAALLVMLTMAAEKLHDRLTTRAWLPWVQRRRQREAAVAALQRATWSPDEVARIRSAAVSAALGLGAGRDMAELLADLTVGRLITSTGDSPSVGEWHDGDP